MDLSRYEDLLHVALGRLFAVSHELLEARRIGMGVIDSQAIREMQTALLNLQMAAADLAMANLRISEAQKMLKEVIQEHVK